MSNAVVQITLQLEWVENKLFVDTVANIPILRKYICLGEVWQSSNGLWSYVMSQCDGDIRKSGFSSAEEAKAKMLAEIIQQGV